MAGPALGNGRASTAGPGQAFGAMGGGGKPFGANGLARTWDAGQSLWGQWGGAKGHWLGKLWGQWGGHGPGREASLWGNGAGARRWARGKLGAMGLVKDMGAGQSLGAWCGQTGSGQAFGANGAGQAFGEWGVARTLGGQSLWGNGRCRPWGGASFGAMWGGQDKSLAGQSFWGMGGASIWGNGAGRTDWAGQALGQWARCKDMWWLGKSLWGTGAGSLWGNGSARTWVGASPPLLGQWGGARHGAGQSPWVQGGGEDTGGRGKPYVGKCCGAFL
eukprot:gene7913-1125_t